MLNPKMEKALNEQVNAEWYSAYLYMSMSAYFQAENLPGFANWMYIQAQEELTHGMKIYNFINERGGRGAMKTIAEPPSEWDSPLAAFEAAYGHEQKVTGLIGGLVELAVQEKDHASNNMLQWFVEEQVEEEASVDEVVQLLKRAGSGEGAMFMIDRELGTRVFTGGALKPAAE
jgi:ferritin